MTLQNATPAREAAHPLASKNPNALTLAPTVDVYENQDEILLITDFPGVPKDAIQIHLDGTELVIEGEQPAPAEGATHRPLAFHRAFRVPRSVDAASVSAELSHGVLRVHLAKSEASKPRRIAVRTG